MAEDTSQGEFANAWKNFLGAARRLLLGPPIDRILDPFLPLRDAALDAAEDPLTTTELQNAWSRLHAGPDAAPEVAHLLLMETQAFPAAVELAGLEQKTGEEALLIKDRLIGLGKTGLDSISDILDTLPPLAKGTITVLKEVFDIFHGK